MITKTDCCPEGFGLEEISKSSAKTQKRKHTEKQAHHTYERVSVERESDFLGSSWLFYFDCIELEDVLKINLLYDRVSVSHCSPFGYESD